VTSSDIEPLERPVQRGEIYWVEFSPVKGREQDKTRPALVVQNDLGNRFSETTVVAAMTHTIPGKPYPFVVIVNPSESGLSDRSTVNCAQLAAIQQAGELSRLRPPLGERRVRPIGRLTPEKMAEVDKALMYNLGIR
jgi:mRNA interferase MazF